MIEVVNAGTTTASRTCGKCGAKISAAAAQGACPACILETGLGLRADEIDAVDPKQMRRGENTESRMLRDFGDYELLEEIGRGGQGLVYRARQKSLNRMVALKVIGLGHWATEAHLKRFRLEAEAAAHLDDPHIVSIYEIGERDGACYFSMKFIAGSPLDKVIDNELMPARKAAKLIVKVARTLEYAHQNGVLHRDVKPGNILIDAKGEPHLTDFGLARLVETESTVTLTMELLGTPSYMAPEQAAGNNAVLTRATDVYGLGAVFYQMLTGHPPFVGETTYEIVRLVLETEPRPPRLWNPRVDRDLSTICLKCLEKDPQRRYSSALALAEDLERWLRHEPIQARRTGLVTRGKKWLQRNPAVALAVASLASLVGVVGGVVWKSDLLRTVPETSIAVLPFENLSNDESNAYFADGIQDEILTRLSKIAALKVISRTSTQKYKSAPDNLREVGKQLGVANLVEGNVQKIAGKVQVNVQLICAATDQHLWAETYDRKLDDVLEVEGEIATAIAQELNAKLTGEEKKALSDKPTQNPAAYDAYLRGVAIEKTHTAAPIPTEAAAAAFAEAVRLDPTFAAAFARLAVARSYLCSVEIDLTINSPAAVKEAADRAIALQPQSGEAWVAQGAYRYRVVRDYAGALQAFAEARRRLPNSAFVLEQTAFVERRLGHWEAAVTHYHEAVRLDPLNLKLLVGGVWAFLDPMRRFTEGQAVLDRALQIAPNDESFLSNKAKLFQNDGRLEEAAKQLALIPATSSDDDVAITRALQLVYERDFNAALAQMETYIALLSKPGEPPNVEQTIALVSLGYCQEWAGRTDDAQATFARVINVIRPSPNAVVPVDARVLRCYLALAYAGIGKKEEALDQARHAVADYGDDAADKPLTEQTLAQIQARFGDRDAAIAALPHLLEVPGGLTRANLRLDPLWNPLRGDPRFEKIVSSLEPKR